MLTVERVKIISKLAFPISIGIGSTLTMALIDLAMVGKLGNRATAALGLSVFSYSLILASVVGIAPAVQGIVARRRGERSTEPGCLPLNGGLLTAVTVGIPLTIICYLLTPSLFSLISSDPEVTRIGVPFLRTLYLGITAVAMNNAFRGYWAGVEQPKTYMVIALFMNALNVLGDYVLIFGRWGAPALGATGAALSTASSLYTGVIINSVIAYLRFRKDGFLKARPERPLVVRIIKLGLPATMQEFFFSASYVLFFWMVGQVGTAELAAVNVLVRVSLLLLIVAMSLGMASATLVSKTIGEGDLAGAAQWGWDTGKLGIIGITLLGLPFFLFPQFVLSFFLSDPHTISMAILPMRLVGSMSGLGSLLYIFVYTLNSVGDGNRVALVALSTQWFFFLPVEWIVGPYLHQSVLQIWLVMMGYAALTTILVTAIWNNGRWKRITI